MMGLSAITAGLALVIALTVGFNARAIGSFFGLLDFPDMDGGRKRHSSVTPLVGGMAVAAAAVVAALVTLRMTPPPPWLPHWSPSA